VQEQFMMVSQDDVQWKNYAKDAVMQNDIKSNFW
jgi:hypothetical protein